MTESVPRSRRPQRWLVGGATVLILGLVLFLAARRDSDGQKPPPPDSGEEPLLVPRPVTLAPGIHLLGRLTPAVAYVVETSAGLVLIDTGMEADASSLRRQMSSLGLDWTRVRAILLTHAHWDHCGGARFLRSDTGATLYAGKGDAEALAAGGPREAFFSTFAIHKPTPEPMLVDVVLKGEETIEVGKVRFRVLAAPGHTPGSICYLMERDGQRVLFSGDIIWSLTGDEATRAAGGWPVGWPVGWPLGTYPTYVAPRYGGNAKDFLSTLRRLRALPVPDLVLPGHPDFDPKPQSPVLSQQRWERLLDMGIHEMERLQARYDKEGANFLDGTPRRLLPDLYSLGECNGVAVYGFLSSSRLILVNAPAGVWKFVEARLRQLGVKAAPAAVLLTSADRQQIEGLAELDGRARVRVVAPRHGREAVQQVCPVGPPFLSAEGLSREWGFPLREIPLDGRGVAPTAYLLRWGQKSVLFTGRVPTPPFQPAWEDALRDRHQGRVKPTDYQAALQRLHGLTVDLWLPAFPYCGQDANLFNGKWSEILSQNRALFR